MKELSIPYGQGNLSTYEASKCMNISREAIHFAIKKNRLKASKIPYKEYFKYQITPEDLFKYTQDKYKRHEIDETGEFISVKKAVEIFNIKSYILYQSIYSKKILSKRSGYRWFINQESLRYFSKSLMKKENICSN